MTVTVNITFISKQTNKPRNEEITMGSSSEEFFFRNFLTALHTTSFAKDIKHLQIVTIEFENK